MRVNRVMPDRRRGGTLPGLLFLAVVLSVALAVGWAVHRATAQDPGAASGAESSTGGDSTAGAAATGGSENTYVAEIIDTVYTVDAAQFFALELPTHAEGASADHLSGSVTMAEKKGDIIVRIFRTADYQGWLKKRDLQHTSPLWSSKKARVINVDMDLPAGVPITMLLDNGYSIRTPKKVHCQFQMQYVRTGEAPQAGVPAAGSPKPASDDLVVPRSNADDEAPPPPPPPDTTSTQ